MIIDNILPINRTSYEIVSDTAEEEEEQGCSTMRQKVTNYKGGEEE